MRAVHEALNRAIERPSRGQDHGPTILEEVIEHVDNKDGCAREVLGQRLLHAVFGELRDHVVVLSRR
jgi:hypothetical protein